ncbi:MAG: oligosaccharide flippase family protein, partial [Actinomycetota bacterium]
MIDDEGALAKGKLTAAEREDVSVVARGGATQIVGQITQRSLGYFFTFVAFRILNPTLYGLYRQVAQVLAVGAQLGLAGYNYAAMRWVARARAADRPGGVRGAMRVGLTGAGIFSLVVLATILLLAEVIARPFGDTPAEDEQLAYLLRVGALYVPLFAMMQVLRYCTQGYKTMVPSVIAGNIVQPGARFVLGVLALGVGYFSLDAARADLLTATVVTLVISVALGMATAGWYLR